MNRISILMYHQVGDFLPMQAHRATYCHHRRFARQMALLARFGYHVLSLDQALACLAGEQATPPRAVVLTFDDGYENFHQYAYPVLQRHGFPAIVYLLSGLIGGRADWLRDDPAPLLNATQIRELRAGGIDFGSHGVSHRRLAELDEAGMRDEIVRSKAELETLLGEAVRHFCYPYGSHNRAVVETTREAGYASGVTCLRASATPAFDPLALPRKAISFGDSALGFWWKVQMKHAPKAEPVSWREAGEG